MGVETTDLGGGNPAKSQFPGNGVSIRALTILCVDAQGTALDTLKNQLLQQFPHCSIATATGATVALEHIDALLAEGREIPLVIAAQQLPEMAGEELLRQLHQRYPQILKVMLTGPGIAWDQLDGVDEGIFYRLLATPWNKTDLRLTVTEALRRYQQEQQLAQQQSAMERANRKLMDVVEQQVQKRLQHLRYSEQQLRLFIEHVPAAVAMFDRDMCYLRVSERWKSDYGLGDQEIIGRSHYDIFPTIPERWRQIHQRCLAGASEQAEEDYFIHEDGSITWEQWEIHPWYTDAGDIGGIVLFSQMITDRKQTEIALKESETLFRELSEASPAIIYILVRRADGSLYFEHISRAVEGIYVASVEQALADASVILDRIHPEDVAGYSAAAQQSFATLQPFSHEWRMVTPSGETRWLRGSSRPNPRDNGEVAWYGVVMDITLRRQAELDLQGLNQQLEQRVQERTQALARSEADLRTIFNNVYDAILIHDLDGTILDANDRALKLRRVTREQLIGISIADLSAPDSPLEIIPEHLQRVQAGETLRFEWQERRLSDQSVFDVEVSLRSATLGDRPVIIAGTRDISDRKRTETALRESEEKFRQLAEVVDAVFWILQLNRTEQVYVSPAYERIWGRPCQDLIVTPDAWLDSIHPQDRDRVLAVLPKQMRGEFDEEYRIVRPDGEVRWIRDRAFPVQNEQGEVYRLAGIAEDITDQKQAEQAMLQQAERETLLREIGQRIRQSLDLQTIFDTACQEIRQVMQADRVGIFKFYPDSGHDDGEFVAESVVNGFPQVLAVRVQDHCFGQKYAPLYMQGRYAAMNDIYQLEECHTSVLAQFQVRANLVMPLLCGDDLWGLLCIHQCSGPRNWQSSEVNLGQQLANQLAIAIQQADLFEQLQQELTERQQTQQQLTASNQQLALSNQELARATRLKDEFLATMSHELRTPLNAILGMSEALQEKVYGEINQLQLMALQTIETSGKHLLELINDILDVSKIEAGQVELTCALVEVVPLCRSSLAFIKPQALKKRLNLNLKMSSQLPPLWVDERRVRQVLINLLNNAVKFTPEGGHITLAVSRPEGQDLPDAPPPAYLRLIISDTGIGIAPEHLARLFQPFVQIDSSLNRQYAGTGLGVAVVNRFVELHGGEVSVTSEVGVGSQFTIDLPCKTPPTPTMIPDNIPETLTPPVEDIVTAAVPTSPLILLAEDNEANINTIVSYLEAKGYRLLLAHDGQEAIAQVQANQPDLILMDIQMPGMDGLEAIQHIRSDRSLARLPIIALTALAMEGDEERCLAAGADEYLSKPVRLKQLTAMIQNLLSPATAC